MYTKKTALITGAARGIGYAIAMQLATTGYDIAIADILPDQDVQEHIRALETQGISVHYIQSDISKSSDRERILNTLKEKTGRLDVLVNNAGVAPRTRTDLLDATEESFDWVLSINLKGPYFLTQLAAKWMIAQKENDAQRTPIIINIASVSSYASSPARGEYCISKAGVSMMTALYADRLAEYGISVFEIRPGIIKTDMTTAVTKKYDNLIANGITPTKRWGLPEDISAAVSSLTSGAFAFSTGQVINVDGGFHLRRL